MSMQLVKIGRLRKPFGVDGHIKIDIKEQYTASLADADVIFAKRADGDIPYFVEAVSYELPPTILLEDIDGPEKASELSMSDIYMRVEDVQVVSEDKDEPAFMMLAGFSIYDNDNELGIIEEILEYPQQVMAQIEVKKQSILIPLTEAFIINIDTIKKEVICDLPEGLIAAQLIK